MVTLVDGPLEGRVLDVPPSIASIAIPIGNGDGATFSTAVYSPDGVFRGYTVREPAPVPDGDGLSSWAELLADAAGNDVIVARAPDDQAVWDRRFDSGFGSSRGDPVLAWSETRVYFPVTYDGSEDFGSAPRNPQAEGQDHVGGE